MSDQQELNEAKAYTRKRQLMKQAESRHAQAGGDEVQGMVERLKARRNKVKDYGANGWFDTWEEDPDCTTAAALLVQLSEQNAALTVDRDEWREACDENGGAWQFEKDRAEAFRALLAEAASGLEPFADQAETFDSLGKEFIPNEFTPAIVDHTVGDLRRARELVTKLKGAL
jgi:hypothetical protein